MEYLRICEAEAVPSLSAFEQAGQATGKSIPFAKYWETVLAQTPITEGLEYAPPAGCLHARWLPRILSSLGTAAEERVIRFADLVNVNGKIFSRSLEVSAHAFSGNQTVTDIILPPSMYALPPAAFKAAVIFNGLPFPRASRISNRTPFPAVKA